MATKASLDRLLADEAAHHQKKASKKAQTETIAAIEPVAEVTPMVAASLPVVQSPQAERDLNLTHSDFSSREYDESQSATLRTVTATFGETAVLFEEWFGPDPPAWEVPPGRGVPTGSVPTQIGKGKYAPRPSVWDFTENVGDPRPDLGETRWWDEVLRMLFRIDGHQRDGVYSLLHGLRCLGAVNLAAAPRGVRIVSVGSPAWETARAAIVADKGKFAALDLVLKGVGTS